EEARTGDLARAAMAGLLPGEQRDGEHAQRERRKREARIERVVLQHHLQEDRERDHQSAERDLLHRLRRDPEAKVLRLEEAWVEQGRLSRALATGEPPGERPEGEDAYRDQRDHEVSALLPDEDPEHDAAHPDRGEDRADDVDAAVTRVRDV